MSVLLTVNIVSHNPAQSSSDNILSSPPDIQTLCSPYVLMTVVSPGSLNANTPEGHKYRHTIICSDAMQKM